MVIPCVDVRGGAFLPSGHLVLTDFGLNRCALFGEDGQLQTELSFSSSLWGMHYDQRVEVLYLSIPEKNKIKMIN